MDLFLTLNILWSRLACCKESYSLPVLTLIILENYGMNIRFQYENVLFGLIFCQILKQVHMNLNST